MTSAISIPLDSIESVSSTVWTALQLMDHSLNELPDKGVGEQCGDKLTVRWARDQKERFFALQVFDASSQDAWEAAVADVGTERALSFFRPILGHCESAASLWSDASGSDRMEVVLKSNPCFTSLVAAYVSQGVPLVVQDRSLLHLMEDDLAYWQGLAKSQAKVIKRTESGPGLVWKDASEGIGASTSEKSALVPRKWRLDQMQEWAAINQERIVILPRALASARRSPYEKPEAVFDALELLAETYRLTKLGKMERNLLKEEVDRQGLFIGGSVDPSNAGVAGDQYYVRWNQRRRFLDQHIGKGSSRDPRFSLRIYYTWCDESERAIVGWLPSHLDTGRS